jgi:hypothetical protein
MGGSYNFSLCFGGIISICTLSKAIGSHKTVNGMALEQTIAKAIKSKVSLQTTWVLYRKGGKAD